MKLITQTPRLQIRQFHTEDKPLFLEIEGDERLTKYIPKRTLEESRELFETILKSYIHENGLGRWGVFDRETGEFIGIGLLQKSKDDPNFIELGYRLHYNFWGKGLATELARALVHYGFSVLNLAEITAVIDPANVASDKVLRKAGFEQQGEVFWYQEMLPFYRVRNSQK